MDNSRRKLIIITASIVLHAITLFVIFVLYHEPSGDLFADFDPSKAIVVAETVFYDPPSEQSASYGVPPPDDQTWGQFKPRASTLGSSMEMPDGPIGVEMPGDTTGIDDASDQQAEDSDNSADTKNSLEFSPQIYYENTEKIVTSSGDASMDSQPSLYGASADTAPRTEVENKSSSSTAKAVTKRARKALAGIARGYLQQLQDEGENLIKTLGGDPNKKPTAEQLKYERYLAKIQWCLQNAHSINQHKCMTQEPIEAGMRVFFVLDREGKMSNFKIVQSSGKAYVDQYISSLFQSASNSFPPLPAYIKEDQFPLTYTILVNWNTASPVGFTRY